MANTKYILESIKVDNELKEIIAKSNGENTTVTYGGKEMTLSAALAEIAASVSDIPSGENIDKKISAAIDELIGGAPEAYDTLKEIANYIIEHEDVVSTLNNAIGGKVDKVEGKGLSAEDFTTALKEKLESLPNITSADIERLNGIRGVRYGTQAPDDMQNGELFVRVVSASE
ncbi:MAG: hypothetical protein HDT42_09255 [Ruminococcaceae bacterium]|nr:hypothetical protein [Oscillospiraceae bacterium]